MSDLRSKNSHAHFISKISVALEEADESLYWLELAVESGLLKRDNVDELFKETNELIAILASSLKTARKNQ
ncbi:four helix bundle protein [candidate division TA06 bacterium]|uniref:Four helix bundle protein n=1 Tax=candidate division TA06 bacterium TaxID=2250710 RepID=A0A523XNN9_UNCT6|nr:MAG: four helix bundle protein [candidate division TA06 bacterium]